jgi:hypothetical protein
LLDLSYSADPAVSQPAQQALQKIAKNVDSHVP